MNVSTVIDLDSMFCGSLFDGDISQWDVARLSDMSAMFMRANRFNGDISEWHVSRVTNMQG